MAKQGIESITVRRAAVADADKVRYRVYSTPTEFVAVIAESALMAVKAAGVAKPHKIVRDLPAAGVAIEAQKMAKKEASAPRVPLNLQQTSGIEKRVITDLLPKEQIQKDPLFKPMTIGDLQRKGLPRARILSPELLSQIIEEHTKAVMPAPVEPPPVAPAPPASATLSEIRNTPVFDAELSTEERITKLAAEVLPGDLDVAPPEEKELSPEEVEKLLNG